jgi:2-phospho-L-lactate guanylyltransferase
VNRAHWAVVPAKCPARGKSRLRPVLADEDRTRFARALLDHVLDVLAGCGLAGVLVATDCEEVADRAQARGAAVRLDGEANSLAQVVDQALADVAGRGATAAIVLMADLPHVVADDVRRVLAELDGHDVVIVRDHEGHHTNALALLPPTAMRTCFGHAESFTEHCAVAQRAGLRVRTLDNERIAFDVDGPADHARLARVAAKQL